ncbi:MAG: DUF1838 family protein [Acidobacteriota bacterium]
MRHSFTARSVVFFVLLALAAIAATPVSALDLDKPEDNVKAMRKLQCHMEDGKPAIYWWSGTTYSRVPGEKDRRLFIYEGMNIRTCKTVEDPEKGYGYRMVSKEVLFYLDPETGEIVRTWKNPWTGEALEVVHIANDPVNSRAPLHANGPRGPYKFDATIRDGRGWLAFEVPLFYPNPLGGDYQKYIGGTYQAIEMFGWYFSADDLLDDSVGGLDDAHVSWSRVAQWLPWMQMGNRAGQVIYHGAGKRVRNWEDLPEVLRNEVAANYPGFDSPPPVDDKRPNETSWTYFKKLVDAKAEAGEAKSGH